MHVTLLSRGISVHTTRRLVEACESLGHDSVVVDPAELQMSLAGGSQQMFWNDQPYGPTDVLIPRIAPSMTTYGLAIVEHFAVSGTAVLNDAYAIANARNKMRLMQLLARHAIPIPATIIGRGASGLKRMVDVVGGFPVAIKLVQTQDKFGIIICESAQSMEAVAEAVISMGHDIIVQRYVTPRKGQDIRAVVLGGKVIAAVRRQPTAGKLRRSLSTGARMSKVVLSPAQKAMALESARVVGLDLAAVDLLALKTGVSQVYDVHSSPGLREVEEAVHADLALPIVRYAAALALARRRSVRPAGRSGLRTSARA